MTTKPRGGGVASATPLLILLILLIVLIVIIVLILLMVLKIPVYSLSVTHRATRVPVPGICTSTEQRYRSTSTFEIGQS